MIYTCHKHYFYTVFISLKWITTKKEELSPYFNRDNSSIGFAIVLGSQNGYKYCPLATEKFIFSLYLREYQGAGNFNYRLAY